MKKFLTLCLVAVLGTALVTGCKKKEEAAPAETSTKEAPAVVEETATTGTATTSTGTMGTMGTESTATATTGTSTTSTATTTTKTN